ncbi:MAG: hypothetical protein GY758_21790 [Fuerstiella sp.]|nr:hypothetical protein [Fuerstiella sp.]MCP4506665.1 hypothetical protein [Fuerstiella sp.]
MTTPSLAAINRPEIASLTVIVASILVTWFPCGVAFNVRDGEARIVYRSMADFPRVAAPDMAVDFLDEPWVED